MAPNIPTTTVVGDRKVTIRALTKDDLEEVFQWMHEMKWPFTWEDLQCCFRQSPGQMFGLFSEEECLLSTCTGTILSETDAYMNFFMTKDGFRRQGLGGALFQATLKSLGDRNVMLDATSSSISFYAKRGFSAYEGFYGWSATLKPVLPPLNSEQTNIEEVTEKTVRGMSAYEKSISNSNRREMFNDLWLNKDNTCFLSKTAEGIVSGYAIINSKTGVLSHLYADSSLQAQALFRSCATALQIKTSNEMPVRFICPEKNWPILKEVTNDFFEGEPTLFERGRRMATQRSPPMTWAKMFTFDMIQRSCAY